MMMSPYAAIFFAGCLEARAYGQQLGDADAVVELGSCAVADRADHFAAVAAGVDVGAERPLPAGSPITRTISSATSAASWPSGKMPATFWLMTSRSFP